MTLFAWLIAGCALSITNLVSLWWTVKHLQSERPWHTSTMMVGGIAVRVILAASLLLLAVNSALGLWSLGAAFMGLWGTRWISLSVLELHLQRGKLLFE